MFTLEIETDNAAFQDGASADTIADMLRTAAELFTFGRVDMQRAAYFTLRDPNGNTCGAFLYTPHGRTEPDAELTAARATVAEMLSAAAGDVLLENEADALRALLAATEPAAP